MRLLIKSILSLINHRIIYYKYTIQNYEYKFEKDKIRDKEVLKELELLKNDFKKLYLIKII